MRCARTVAGINRLDEKRTEDILSSSRRVLDEQAEDRALIAALKAQLAKSKENATAAARKTDELRAQLAASQESAAAAARAATAVANATAAAAHSAAAAASPSSSSSSSSSSSVVGAAGLRTPLSDGGARPRSFGYGYKPEPASSNHADVSAAFQAGAAAAAYQAGFESLGGFQQQQQQSPPHRHQQHAQHVVAQRAAPSGTGMRDPPREDPAFKYNVDHAISVHRGRFDEPNLAVEVANLRGKFMVRKGELVNLISTLNAAITTGAEKERSYKRLLKQVKEGDLNTGRASPNSEWRLGQSKLQLDRESLVRSRRQVMQDETRAKIGGLRIKFRKELLLLRQMEEKAGLAPTNSEEVVLPTVVELCDVISAVSLAESAVQIGANSRSSSGGGGGISVNGASSYSRRHAELYEERRVPPATRLFEHEVLPTTIASVAAPKVVPSNHYFPAAVLKHEAPPMQPRWGDRQGKPAPAPALTDYPEPVSTGKIHITSYSHTSDLRELAKRLTRGIDAIDEALKKGTPKKVPPPSDLPSSVRRFSSSVNQLAANFSPTAVTYGRGRSVRFDETSFAVDKTMLMDDLKA